MMVEDLLQGLSTESELSPAQATTITNTVIPLLEGILLQLTDERDEDRNYMDNTLPNADLWNTCLQPGVAYTEASNEAASTFVTFKDLSEEGTVWSSELDGGVYLSDMDKYCVGTSETGFHTWFNAKVGTASADAGLFRKAACAAVPTATSSSSSAIEDWRKAMTTVKTGWENYYADFNTKYQTCKSYWTKYAGNKELADAAQIAFETALCQWNDALTNMCVVHQACIKRLKNHHAVSKAHHEARDAVRVDNARTLKYLIQVLNNIAGNVSDTSTPDLTSFETIPGGGCNYNLRNTNGICNFSSLPFPDEPTPDVGDGECDTTEATLLGQGSSWMLTGDGPNLAGDIDDSAITDTTAISNVKYTTNFRNTETMDHTCNPVATYWTPPGTRFAGASDDWQVSSTNTNDEFGPR